MASRRFATVIFAATGTDGNRMPLDLSGTLAVTARFGSRLGLFNPRKCREFSMRNSVFFAGLGIALLAASSAARAQTVETVMAPAVGPAVVVQGPVAVPPSGVLLPPASAVAVAAPVETVETVRTVTTTEPRRVRHRAVRPRTVNRVTTITRTTTVRPGVVVPGVVAAAPVYDEPMRGPRLYDMVTSAPGVAPVVGTTTAIAAPAAMPVYRYVYQPDRILVVDPYTDIPVQVIPR